MKNNKNDLNRPIKIDLSLINKAKVSKKEESQTIIHCNYIAPKKFEKGGWININSTTFLINETGKQRVKLIHNENIPISPDKHYFLNPGDKMRFTLIFQGIPKTWNRFSLCEKTLIGDGFVVNDIFKNKSGVYEININ